METLTLDNENDVSYKILYIKYHLEYISHH